MRAILFLLLFSMSALRAEVIQIIHTNDLHTYLEGSNSGRGGYARLKTLIDKLRKDALDKGIPSLYLDGGDFGEGSSFFAAERGAYSFRTLDLLGADATVLGNHDHILGPAELASVLKRSGFKTPLLSANLSGKKASDLMSIADSKDFQLGNLKVRVIGLSTPEKHAQYTLRPSAKMKDPIETALPLIEKAKKENVHFVISLSHTGIGDDLKLIEKSSNLGLVVGGHDHLVFEKPRMGINKKGVEVPVLQVGAHSAYLGQLILDVDQDGRSKILEYKLHEITPETPEDSGMRALIEAAKISREEFFQRSWDEVIGESSIILTGRIEGRMKKNRSCWSKHIARMSRESSGADIGLQFDVLQSSEIPAGKITFGNIIDNFVHFNDWNPRGWELTTLKITGVELEALLYYLRSPKNEFSSSVDGIEVLEKGKVFTRYLPTEHQSRKKFINGKPLSKFKTYTITLPLEVSKTLEHSIPVLGKLFTRNQDRSQKLYIWEELEAYVRRNSPLECLDW